MHLKGYRFFADDEDHYSLEDILQANMLLKTGSAYTPAKPWQHGVANKFVDRSDMLSKAAQQHFAQMSASASEL